MRGEDQSRLVAQISRQGQRGLGDRIGEHGYQQWMVEVLPQFGQFRRAGANSIAGTGDVLLILGASRVAAPGRRTEHRCSGDTVGSHRRHRLLDERMPVAITEVHRQILVAIGQFSLNLGDQRTIDRSDRRHPAEMQIVLGDGRQAFRWYPPAPGDVLQERHHLLGTFRPAEGQQQQGVE